jgi:outer membrane protein assembly factor BamA
MKKKSAGLLMILTITCIYNIKAAEDTLAFKEKRTETLKTGWTFGALPAVAFDTDVGITYGGVVNLFYYGNGTTYPKYIHSLYLEWSRTTKGSGINQIIFDSDSIFKKVRTFAEFSYLTESLLDFYGFNGYESYFDKYHSSRLFYRQQRQLLRIRTDFLGNLGNPKFKWFGGLEYNNIQLDTIDLGKVNKGKDMDELVPASGGGLYGKYKEWGLLPTDQFDGGVTTFLKGGLVYDTRDNEANPGRGFWTEFQYLWAPGFIGNSYAYSKLIVIHRHYITLFPKKLTFAYRINYQGKVGGEMPSYMLPFVYNSPPSLTRDGLGGKKTVRGVLRNRIVGEDYLYGNFELRWKCYQRVIFNQNFYLGWNFFFDSGAILKPYQLQNTQDYEAILYLSQGKKDGLHHGIGTGLRFALNDNFIVAIDYGVPLSKEDGDQGFYMGFNYLF